MDAVDTLRLRGLHVKHPLWRNLLAEFFGTALLLFIGDSIVAQLVLSRDKINTWIQINIGWALAIVFSVQAVARTSGGHLNPAISLAVCTLGRLPVLHFLLYSIAQILGAFVGSAGMYLVYYETFNAFDGGNRMLHGINGTGNIFCSYPAPHVSMIWAIIDQIAGTGVLALLAAIVIDRRSGIPSFLHPLYFGFIVCLIGCSFGMNLGYPINPARDFGPRLFSAFIYGGQVFSHPFNGYFLAPIIGPMIGAVLGIWIYQLCSGLHLPELDEVNEYRIVQVHNDERDQVKLLEKK